jgi:hypothetical protein
VYAVLHERCDPGLAPIALRAACSRPPSVNTRPTRRNVSLLSRDVRYKAYLDHKQFTFYTDNQALWWLLKQVRKLGRVGRILCLSSFKFTVVHVPGKTNVVADCLTRQYDNPTSSQLFVGLGLQHLTAEFMSIRQHQIKEPQCREI